MSVIVFLSSMVGLSVWAPLSPTSMPKELTQLREEVQDLRKEVQSLRQAMQSLNLNAEHSPQMHAEELPAVSSEPSAVGHSAGSSSLSLSLEAVRLHKSPTLEDAHVAEYCKSVLDLVAASPDDEVPLWKYARESRTNDPSKNAFQGQKFADVFFYSALWKHLDRPGVYVDLASNDYRHISNTYFADHCLKFRGLCIEPNPKYWPNLDKKRHCAVVKTCIADKPRDVEFVLDGAMGGIADQFKGKLGKAAITKMHCDTLSNVFRQYNVKHVDYMSLDVEGVELPCLQGIDWEAVRIDVIAVERNPKFAALKEFLLAREYIETVELVHDTVFVHSKADSVLAAMTAWRKTHCAKVNEAVGQACKKPGCKAVEKC